MNMEGLLCELGRVEVHQGAGSKAATTATGRHWLAQKFSLYSVAAHKVSAILHWKNTGCRRCEKAFGFIECIRPDMDAILVVLRSQRVAQQASSARCIPSDAGFRGRVVVRRFFLIPSLLETIGKHSSARHRGSLSEEAVLSRHKTVARDSREPAIARCLCRRIWIAPGAVIQPAYWPL